jgi:hypothetical protein
MNLLLLVAASWLAVSVVAGLLLGRFMAVGSRWDAPEDGDAPTV